MYLSRRGCSLREDSLSRLGLRATTPYRRNILPVAPRYLRVTCPKLSYEPVGIEKMCGIGLFPSWPPSEALKPNLFIVDATLNSG